MTTTPTPPPVISEKRGRAQAEAIEQARLLKWSHRVDVRALMPDLRWLHHSPNGGKRDALTGATMKAMGVKPGFPDLILPTACNPIYPAGLVIELKQGRGRASGEQDEWMQHFEKNGWCVELCYGSDEARLVILNFFRVDASTAPGFDA